MKIVDVDPASPLFGHVRPGYKVVAINGRRVLDAIDFRYRTADERVTIRFADRRGRELERRLSEDQRALVARAYREAGADAVEGFRTVLRNLINEQDRKRFETGEAPVRLAVRS